MTYTIDESLSDTEFTAGGSVASTFGTPRNITSITIHHYGAFGQSPEGVVNFFINQNKSTSAHFVACAYKIWCLVSPLDAAWSAGNAYGNATSIHIECPPEATDGDYKAVAWLVSKLRGWYGATLPLVKHSSWTATACPGRWDLARLDKLARTAGSPPPAVAAPAPSPAPMTARVFSDDAIHWIVGAGDTLTKIQRYYGGPSVATIAAYNNIDPNKIRPGQKVWIPGPLEWLIEAPDTVRTIAAYYGLDAGYLARRNGLSGPDAEIYIGNVLQIA